MADRLADRFRRVLQEQRGFALVIALGVTVVLSMTVVTVIEAARSNQRSATMSSGRAAAYDLAEAGVNNAMSVLRLPTNNALDKYVFCPTVVPPATAPQPPCTNTNTYSSGTVTWYGNLYQNPAAGTAYWDLFSTGHVRNPFGGTDYQKTIRATIPVVPVTTQPLNNPSWNYIFSRAPGTGVAFSGCDMTLGNSVDVTAPLYVMGNLCLQNTASISKGPLIVKGSLDQQATQNHVGAAGANLNEAHIGKGCRYKNQASHNPCVYGAGGTTPVRDNIWATILDATPAPVTAPTVLWNDWYLNASPGPYFPCAAPLAGEPANPTFAFDNPITTMSDSDANKLTYRNDNQGIVNLTPGSSYTCKTVNGQLSWDYPNKVLTLSGTIFIDGSAKVDIGGVVRYHGQATIYTSGSVLIKNTSLCGYSSGPSCTVGSWNSTQDLLGFVVNGNGSNVADNQVSSGDGAQFVSAYFQGAVYATNIVDIGTTSIVDGPLDGSTVILGQSSNSTFNGFTFVPVGMPGNPTVYALAQTPQMTGG
jgi:hypothetical protein